MTRVITLGIAGLLLLTACQKAPEPGAVRDGAVQQFAEAPEASRRFLAVAHRLLIETAEDALPKAWESAAELCRTLRCAIVASGISNRTPDSPPSANLALRIAPDDLQKMFDHLGKAGRLLQHVTESEDKTATVIDVEARLRNLSEFRNRLRTMLATRPAALKDVIEIERELARVQSELDSLTTQRKVLANETEKVAVRIEFRSRRSAVGTGVFAPISRAWNNAAYVLSESVATLLTFVVALLPWLLLIVPGSWLATKLLRRWLHRRRASESRP